MVVEQYDYSNDIDFAIPAGKFHLPDLQNSAPSQSTILATFS